MKAELNRRDFLKSAAVTGALAAGGAMLAGCSGSASPSKSAAADAVYPEGLIADDFAESPVEVKKVEKFDETKDFELVIVGAGTGGLPAALTAIEEGAKSVAVLQKESEAVSQVEPHRACCWISLIGRAL